MKELVWFAFDFLRRELLFDYWNVGLWPGPGPLPRANSIPFFLSKEFHSISLGFIIELPRRRRAAEWDEIEEKKLIEGELNEMKWRGWLEWKSITHYAGLSMNEIHWMEAAVNKLTSLLHSIPQIKSKTFNLISLNSRSFVNLMELNCIITVWVILWIWYKDKIIDGINLLMESIMNYLYEYEKYYRRSPSATQINSFLLFENGKKRLIWFAAGSAAPREQSSSFNQQWN